MKHGSLFSGIGGFDLAAEWMGWENVFHCEWNEFGQQVLKHYWPKAKSYEDITKTDFNIHRGQIDILSGGFPCQPYSQAGKRLGKEDDRHLWPEMLRAIREIQPTWVVGENVLGLVNWDGGVVFDEVQADLEAQGYEVQPFVLPASGVGAPHQRQRVWFVAYSSEFRCKHNGVRGKYKEQRKNGNERFKDLCAIEDASNSSSEGLEGSEWSELQGRSDGLALGSVGDAANTNGSGGVQNNIKLKANESEYARACWEQFPTQSTVCRRNDGFSDRLDGITFPKWRSESIKAYGNAIVPQVALQIFKAIESFG